MENKDNNIYNRFKEAADNRENKSFPHMESIWNRIEEKLDDKKQRKVIPWYKYAGIAALLLLCLTIGTFIFRDNNTTPAVPENNVTTIDYDKIKQAAEPAQRDTFIKEEVVVNEKGVEVVKPQYIKSSTNKDSESTSKNSNIRQASVLQNSKVTTNADGSITITGIVLDSTGPLPGANVIVMGTQNTTQTDIDGKFTITAKPGNKLEVSYLGYSNQSLAVNTSKRLNVMLQENSQPLSEVRIDKYRSTTKSTSTAAVTTISVEAIEERANASMVQSLQGQVQGLQITQSTNEGPYRKYMEENYGGNDDEIKQYKGTKATDSSIVLRGISTLNGNVEPLFIIDGIPADENTFKSINQNKIKSFNVLKNEAATSIYGNRGANGVIIIETKMSRKEKRKFKKLIEENAKRQKNDTTEFRPIVPESNEEEYESFTENQFENPKTAPLSTFSIDVDNASYTNIRRFLNEGQIVPKDAVRVEEMINFFKYDYPQPKGSEPFSINTEYSDAPWNPKHKLLKIGLKGKEIASQNLPASNFVFLIDVSGSMSESNKLPLLKQSMKLLVNQMRKQDRVAIVVYAGAAGLVLPSTSGSEKEKIIAALDNLNAGGSTAGGAGIELAYKTAQENFIKNGNNRVILATDGDFNVGASSNTDMETLIEQKRKSGVFLTCLGYGMGNYKDSKMEILSDKGNGNYAYIDNMQEATRFLDKEFKGSMYAIAKDVKIQIEFNPKYVQSYRLIGYENRKLRDEDFVNDAIDAGELGSGHTVTALYEIIPVGVKSDYFTTEPQLKYSMPQAPAGNYNDELATIKFRHKKPDEEVSKETVQIIPNTAVPLQKATGDFKFAASVAWFGLKLRDSKLVPDKTTEHIKTLAKEGLQNDPEGYRAEFIRLVEMVK